MHDLAEGCIKYAMFHIVNHHVYKTKNPKLSLRILNERIKIFDYYLNGFSNGPPLISENNLKVEKRIKMSGSEMLNFFLTYAMLVGDIIVFDKVWDYYLKLRKIVHIVFAPSIQLECNYMLDELVKCHNHLYVKLFNDTLKHKFHFLVHYGRIIRHSGPIY